MTKEDFFTSSLALPALHDGEQASDGHLRQREFAGSSMPSCNLQKPPKMG
jgi:hypothetical protein